MLQFRPPRGKMGEPPPGRADARSGKPRRSDMRLSRKQIGTATRGASQTMRQAFVSKTEQLEDWCQRINPDKPKEVPPDREKMLMTIVLDILDRSFKHLGD
jgi:hypothetical protein